MSVAGLKASVGWRVRPMHARAVGVATPGPERGSASTSSAVRARPTKESTAAVGFRPAVCGSRAGEVVEEPLRATRQCFGSFVMIERLYILPESRSINHPFTGKGFSTLG